MNNSFVFSYTIVSVAEEMSNKAWHIVCDMFQAH